MRFIYGTILGMLATVIGAILYLAFAGGDYLLALSPKYHDLASRIENCSKAEAQRDQLAQRLESLEASFEALTRRFNELPSGRPEPHAVPDAGSPPARPEGETP
jgi:hypothetical protein